MFKVKNRHQNNVIDCAMSSCQGPRSGVFTACSNVSIVIFEQANPGWADIFHA